MYCGEIVSSSSLADGTSDAADVDQQLPRDAKSFADPATLVEVRVVDQTFPSDGRSRFLEIDAHHDFERVSRPHALFRESLRVVARGGGVVDRARTDDHQKAIVLAAQDPANPIPGGLDQRFERRALDREKADQVLGRRQQHHVDDVLVVGA
jgi:hypothetical protein